MSKTVMAQGTFDILHPGHIHYLEKSAELGDELVVVISRDSRVKNRKDSLAFSEDERKEIVGSLEAVDRAVLGSEEDIYTTVKEISPDIITLGHDQQHSVDEVKNMAEKALEREVEVQRIETGTEHSSSDIKASPQEK
jgi:FAD synthetase